MMRRSLQQTHISFSSVFFRYYSRLAAARFTLMLPFHDILFLEIILKRNQNVIFFDIPIIKDIWRQCNDPII